MRLDKRTREVMNKGWIEHREKRGPAALEHTLVDERKLTEIHAHTQIRKNNQSSCEILVQKLFFFLPNTQLQSVNQLVTSQRATVEKCSHKFTLLKNEVKSLCRFKPTLATPLNPH